MSAPSSASASAIARPNPRELPVTSAFRPFTLIACPFIQAAPTYFLLELKGTTVQDQETSIARRGAHRRTHSAGTRRTFVNPSSRSGSPSRDLGQGVPWVPATPLCEANLTGTR